MLQLPNSVPLQDINSSIVSSKRICVVVNKTSRIEPASQKADNKLQRTLLPAQEALSIAAKDGDLLGRPVADDLDNFAITYDWMSIFDVPWRRVF